MADTIEQAVIDDLKAQSSVNAYVGKQIYYLKKDRGAENNYIVIYNPSHTRNAIFATGDAYGQARLQINCYSRDAWTAKSIAEAVKEVYRKRTGIIQGMTVQWVEINQCRPLPGVNETNYFVDVTFYYNE